MTQQTQFQILRIPRWAVVLAGIAAAAFAIALFLLSVTVFLILLPVIAVAGGLYYLFGGRRQTPRRAGHVEIIEGEYRVVEPEKIERGDDGRQAR